MHSTTRRIIPVLIALTLATAAALVATVTPAQAADTTGFPSNTFMRLDIEISQTDHDSVGVVLTGIFTGVAGRSVTTGAHATWEQSKDSYVGPYSLVYHRYRNKANGQCLTHSGGYVGTAPCTWSDNSQWWTRSPTFPDSCSGELSCYLDHWMIRPWNAPDLAMTLSNDFITVTPIAGPVHNVNQQRFSWKST